MELKKKRPGHLTAYAKHARITKTAAAEQLRRVGINYMEPFDFTEADKLLEAARHADRAPFSRAIFVKPGESPRDSDDNDSSSAAGGNPTFTKYQAQREKFKAKISELDYLERIGTLVQAEEVEADAYRVARQVRDAILNVPSRLAGILAAESGQRRVHDLLEQELRQALEALASGVPERCHVTGFDRGLEDAKGGDES